MSLNPWCGAGAEATNQLAFGPNPTNNHLIFSPGLHLHALIFQFLGTERVQLESDPPIPKSCHMPYPCVAWKDVQLLGSGPMAPLHENVPEAVVKYQ